jgi:hypothetical protein
MGAPRATSLRALPSATATATPPAYSTVLWLPELLGDGVSRPRRDRRPSTGRPCSRSRADAWPGAAAQVPNRESVVGPRGRQGARAGAHNARDGRGAASLDHYRCRHPRPARGGSLARWNVNTTRRIAPRSLGCRPDRPRALNPVLPVRAVGDKALLVLVAPGRRCWSRWSARSEARTYDLDRPEGRCMLAMG